MKKTKTIPESAAAGVRTWGRRLLESSSTRLLGAVFLCWFLWGLAEVAFFGVHSLVHPFRYKLFVLDQAMRLLFWGGVGLILASMPRAPRVLAVVALGLTLSYLTVSAWLLAAELGDFFSAATILPLLENPELLTGYSQSYLRGWNVAFWLLGALVFVAAWSPIVRQSKQRGGWKTLTAGTLLLVLALVPLNQLSFRSAKGGAVLSIEGSLFVALKQARGRLNDPNHDTPSRRHVAPYESEERLNILLVLVESWAKPPLQLDTPETAMPFLSRWMAEESDRFVFFKRAFTNSADTKVSVPSVMTGISPERPRSDLYQAPLFWHWGVASGHQAFYVSSQIYKWVNFYRFFIDDFPGEAITAETIDAPLVNDLGVDDLVSVREFQRLLRQRDPTRPFIAGYNPNALHFPGQQTSELLDEPLPAGLPRYHAALRIVDEALRTIHSTLEEQSLLDDTVVIMAADHGEHVLTKGELPRLLSYDLAIANTPLLVRVPASWAARHPEKHRALLQNRDRIVANVDVVPTVADFLGARVNRANAILLDDLSGSSLLAPLPPSRRLVSLTPMLGDQGTGAFSVIQDEWRLVHASTANAPKLFDMKDDPENAVNLWSHHGAAIPRARLLEAVRNDPKLEPILPHPGQARCFTEKTHASRTCARPAVRSVIASTNEATRSSGSRSSNTASAPKSRRTTSASNSGNKRSTTSTLA